MYLRMRTSIALPAKTLPFLVFLRFCNVFSTSVNSCHHLARAVDGKTAREKLRNRLRIALSFVILASLSSCSIDHGIGEIKSRITGRVVFVDSQNRPAYADQARVVAVYQFPPAGLGDVLYSNTLPAGRDTSQFEILAQKGTYAALGVLWRRVGEGWSFSNLLGLYTAPNELAPRPVTVSDENPVADSIDIYATWTLALRDARIEGDITFVGAWPGDTQILGLAAFPIVPNLSNPSDLLQLRAIDISIPLFVDRYHYRLALAHGTYKFIALFWKGTSTPVEKIRPIGFYASKDNPNRPAEITLQPNERVTGIDVVANFDTLPDGISYEIP